VFFLFESCFKKDSGCNYQKNISVASVTDQQNLQKYLDSAGINATLDSDGFYYQIISSGSGTPPDVCSVITVTYTGQLTNGNVFDQETNQLYTLGGLIAGWQQGLPLISKGGVIKLYIPPSLGYGNTAQDGKNGNVAIPANSILIFNIDLINVQ
jgi:FKBP-type peptidyl-prolyl cis-trans isomerase FkpA